MYANNVDDFWFDFSVLIGPSLICFTIASLAILFFFLITHIISKLAKRQIIIYYYIIIVGVLLICTYIHSEFLANLLPPLDGSTIDWNDVPANLISIIVYIIAIGISIFGIIKLKPKKTAQYISYISLAIFAMLFVSFSSTLLTTDALTPKTIIANATDKNLNLVSNKNNYLILLVDAVDSTHFNHIVQSNHTYQKSLKDFSYYPDTLSGYAFTRDSVPFIFSSQWNENQTSFTEYSTSAYNNSEFFSELFKQDYNKNFYEMDITWDDPKVLEFDNVTSAGKDINTFSFIKQSLRYILFKSLPHPLKRFSRIEEIDFNVAKSAQEYSTFDWGDVNFYQNCLHQSLEKTDQNYFQFIHIEGGHTPFDLDKNVEPISNKNGTYEEKLEATMKIIVAYLERLKTYNVYDNSTIVILADHGFWHNGTSRANPILYIKGTSEKHDHTIVSDKQVSYADLQKAFIELLSGKNSTEIFSEIPTSGRTRRFIYNGFNEEEHMYEYEQTGKAWETTSLQPTGKVYDL